jgi:hypothetical protein
MRDLKNSLLVSLIIYLSSTAFAQDTTSTPIDTANVLPVDSSTTILTKNLPLLTPKPNPLLMKPTLPPMQISAKQKRMDFNISPQQRNFLEPGDAGNYDALRMPPTRNNYYLSDWYLPPLIPITPVNPNPEERFLPLPFYEYSIPTRQELDVLEILWVREDVMDTTIYSTLDSSAQLTMMDLQTVLERMASKGFLSRKLVSPRFEFNAFGIMIEMSSTNRRNRVFEYRSKVDEATMKRFIDANAFLYKNDKSIVNYQRLQAARTDSTLLDDLNLRIKQPKLE